MKSSIRHLKRPVRRRVARPTMFIDRDGVVNRNRDDYVKSWEEFEFLPGSLEAFRILSENGVRVVVVTNQSAVGRKIMSKKTLAGIHRRMADEVRAYGGKIEAILCCPHAPEEGCDCRKPQPGLLVEAMTRYHVDPAVSCFVGDSTCDLKAAEAAGLPFVMVLSGKVSPMLPYRNRRGATGGWLAPDLESAARWFIRRNGWHREASA